VVKEFYKLVMISRPYHHEFDSWLCIEIWCNS